MKKERSREREEANLATSWPSRRAKAVLMQRRVERVDEAGEMGFWGLWSLGVSESSDERASASLIRSLRASRMSPKKSWLMRWAYLARPSSTAPMRSGDRALRMRK